MAASYYIYRNNGCQVRMRTHNKDPNSRQHILEKLEKGRGSVWAIQLEELFKEQWKSVEEFYRENVCDQICSLRVT